MRIKSLLTVGVIALLSAGSAYWYWQHAAMFPSTDDAYIQANVIHIAPQIAGRINQVEIQDHQLVHQGQLLFSIDPAPYQLALQKAQANLDLTKQQIAANSMAVQAAQAVLRERTAEQINAQLDQARIEKLVREHFYAKSQGDQAIKNLQVANAAVSAANASLLEAQQKLGAAGDQNAQLRTAQTALAQAQLNLSYTQVYAPENGYLENVSVRIGDTVTAYQELFALVESKQFWVDANFKETDLARIRPHQTATIKVDMYPNYVFTGQVLGISTSSGDSFSLLPPENASGNWVKVTQRFPVKILITNANDHYPLRIGASSTVTINTQPTAS